jgi:hypothetical protein
MSLEFDFSLVALMPALSRARLLDSVLGKKPSSAIAIPELGNRSPLKGVNQLNHSHCFDEVFVFIGIESKAFGEVPCSVSLREGAITQLVGLEFVV